MPKDFQLRDVLKRSVQEPKRVSIYRDVAGYLLVFLIQCW